MKSATDSRSTALGNVEEAVVTVIGDQYGLYGRSLDPNTDLKTTLGADDVDYLEIIMTLEELFSCRLQPLPPDPPTRLGDIIALCQQAVNARLSGSSASEREGQIER